ncbi:AAA family ATPase [Candidatus Pacearchaeota archaeon]|nr:AAA family ATPase [Candidatus Pacearchaeota archaeon]
MTKKYILTGAPGSGKSSVLLELEKRGEHVIREAAEDVIKLAQAKGIEEPWINPDFQKEILELQLKREERIPPDASRVFIDRGILDGLAYVDKENELYWEILKQAPRYKQVFLIERLGETERTRVRREDDITAFELECKVREAYLLQKYKVHKIPADSVEERADLILRMVERSTTQ